MLAVALWASASVLAFANGTNDVLKGVAPLWGGTLLPYRRVRILALAASFAGCVIGTWFGTKLAERFSGAALLPDEIAGVAVLRIAVAVAAAATLLAASAVGMPISTTHALLGSLVGSGLAFGGTVDLRPLVRLFALPLLLSPPLAAAVAVVMLRRLDTIAQRSNPVMERLPGGTERSVPATPSRGEEWRYCGFPSGRCRERQCGGPPTERCLAAHWQLMFVSTLICLARAANDTPKLAAICLFGTGRPVWPFLLVMTAMLLGGSVFGKPVAITMSHRISKLDVSAALAASWATVLVTMPATFLGLPVSSTHVTAGAIAGVGTARRRLVEQTLREVLVAWFTTLPASAGLAWVLGSVLLLVVN